MRRGFMRELNNQFGQIGLDSGNACLGQRGIQTDLVGRERFHFDHLGGAAQP